jgi:hypothetical protein
MQERYFDLAANRRSPGVQPGVLLCDGIIYSTQLIDSVAIADTNGFLLGAGAAVSDTWNADQLFNVQANLPKLTGDYAVDFFQKGKLRFADRGHDLHAWTNKVVLPDTGETLFYSCALRVSQSPNQQRLAAGERRAPVVYRVIFWIGLLVTVTAAFFGKASGRVPMDRLLGCLLVATGWLTIRAAFYGLIEANTGWAAERYMRCVSPLFAPLLFLAVAIAVGWIKNKMGKKELKPIDP